jgi:hypothetical protein
MIGGPAHGQERELEPGQKAVTIIGQEGDGTFQPVQYVVRGIQAETRPGKIFQRDILVEGTLSVEVATQALAAVLLQKFADELVRQFMEGGEPIGIEENTTSGSDEYPSGLLRA